MPNHEVGIHNRLYKNYLENNKILRSLALKEYFFDEEVLQIDENFNTKGRIDLKVYHNKDREIRREAYYTIELKRIDGKSHLNKEYVKSGIERFTSEKYECFFNIFGMIGFVVSPIDINNNVMKINEILQNDCTITTISPLQIEPFSSYAYKSKHKTLSGRTLETHHQFWDFSSIIAQKKKTP